MKKFFLPGHSNSNKRAHSVSISALFSYVFALALFFVTSSWVTYHPEVLGYATNVSVRSLFEKTNELRSRFELSPLKLNTKLNEAAAKKAEDMFANDYWSHNSPVGKEPWDFIRSSKYEYIYAGENLAVDFAESDEVISAWYDSMSHRENLLNDKFTEVGFAEVDGTLKGRKTTLVVQMFGYPKPSNEYESLAVGISEPLSDEQILDDIEKTQSLTNTVGTDTVLFAAKPLPVYSFFPMLTLSRAMSIVVGIFLILIFAIDGYYAKNKVIYRVTGHTVLHILMLVLAVFGIWLTNIGWIL